jgi:L-seryl-tRNA(Ser) seleniumtransferase
MTEMNDPRRSLPSMDALLNEPEVEGWANKYGRKTVKDSLRSVVDEVRSADLEESPHSIVQEILAAAAKDLLIRSKPSLVHVLNGTGVVLHTNLGRAPLPKEALEAQERVSGYSNVELSLRTGVRGSRYDHCADLVCELVGADAAVVANNNAAAVSLVVNEMARGKDVLISRGELVEIGGSFRIPDVIASSGAQLREVGTTNRTRAKDYEKALSSSTGLILRVHPSNYRVEGFTERPGLEEIVELARRADIPVAHDIGSGLLSPDLLPGFPHTPSVSESLAAGVDIVTWSGDKILGGPQTGIIAGSTDLIARLRQNPMLRAFRVDKTTLAALEATLMLYRDPDLAADRIPVLRMLRESPADVESRARDAVINIAVKGACDIAVESMRGVVGGGSYPGFELESAGWVVRGVNAAELAEACRAESPPLLGYVEQDAFKVDMRTIALGQEIMVAKVLSDALAVFSDGDTSV